MRGRKEKSAIEVQAVQVRAQINDLEGEIGKFVSFILPGSPDPYPALRFARSLFYYTALLGTPLSRNCSLPRILLRPKPWLEIASDALIRY